MTNEIHEIMKAVQSKLKEADLRLGNDETKRVSRLKTGLLPLDEILGGGLPYGRITLVKGDESSGKTLLCQYIFKAAQAEGLPCAFVDVEQTFDPDWFQLTGVDVSKLIVSVPGGGEDALDTVCALVEAGVKVVALDSIAALVPVFEAEELVSKNTMGAQARLLNKGLRKLTLVNKGAVVLLLNQTRLSMNMYAPEALPGGLGQRFFASIMLDLSRRGWITPSGEDKTKLGFNIHVRTDKNKTYHPLLECDLPFIFEGGVIDLERGLVELAIRDGVITRKGPWYYHPALPEGKMQGQVRVADYLKEHADVRQRIKEQVEGAKNTNTHTKDGDSGA